MKCNFSTLIIIYLGSSSQCGNLNPNTNRYCGNNLNDYVMAVANTEICGMYVLLLSHLVSDLLNVGKWPVFTQVYPNFLLNLLDCTTPFEVTVITNAAADGIDGPANDANDVPSKGVCLDYVQIPCA